jgi:predicted DCC family thiol-disulfide oxidoreductase YuxK
LRLITLVFHDLPDEFACKQPIVLFDGECSLCSSSVRFILRHNNKSNLHFASQQSIDGMKLLMLAGKKVQQSDTLLLLQDSKLYGYSTAALKIAAHLGFPCRLLVIFMIFPVQIRDFAYRYIVRNRYTWFGRKTLYTTDTKYFQERFLS